MIHGHAKYQNYYYSYCVTFNQISLLKEEISALKKENEAIHKENEAIHKENEAIHKEKEAIQKLYRGVLAGALYLFQEPLHTYE